MGDYSKEFTTHRQLGAKQTVLACPPWARHSAYGDYDELKIRISRGFG
jgi:hypothetical protein